MDELETQTPAPVEPEATAPPQAEAAEAAADPPEAPASEAPAETAGEAVAEVEQPPEATDPAPAEAVESEPQQLEVPVSEAPAETDGEFVSEEAVETVSAEEFLETETVVEESASTEDARLRAVLEAIVYITDEPLTLAQIAAALSEPQDRVQRLLDEIVVEFDKPGHGLTIREVAGGYKMATKPEHHDDIRNFVKSLKPPLKLSLAALETLAVIAYKQPVTAPEIMEIRGVQGAGVLKTLLDRKLIAVAGRKNVIGKPILYKTTKEFLIQFGLKDLAELPTLKEFEEIGRLALAESEPAPAAEAPAEPAAEAVAEPPAEAAAAADPPAEAPSEEPAATEATPDPTPESGENHG